MSIFGRVLGGTALAKKLKDIGEKAEDAQKKTLKEAVLLVHETAIKSIQSVSQGERQMRYNPQRMVTVSEAGDAPNTDTGRLVQSIQFEILEKGLVGRVGTNLKYGAWLEFGTKHMSARPWLQPAIVVAAAGIQQIARDNLEDAMRSATGKQLKMIGGKVAKIEKKSARKVAKLAKKAKRSAKRLARSSKKSFKAAKRSSKKSFKAAKKSFKSFKKSIGGKRR